MPKEKKQHRIRRWLFRLLMVLVLIVSLLLIFNEQVKLFMVNHMQQSGVQQAQQLDADELAKNKKRKTNWDFSKVESLNLSTVSKAALARNLHPIGLVSVPSVNIHLPILNGVTSSNLAVGAGTMKENQEMGKNNYALAGHHIHKRTTLFSPLENVKKGAQIYITDKKTVYVYKINFIKVVDKHQVQYIDDVPNKKMITLVTCASDLINQPERQIVQGELVKTEKATDKNLQVFAN